MDMILVIKSHTWTWTKKKAWMDLEDQIVNEEPKVLMIVEYI